MLTTNKPRTKYQSISNLLRLYPLNESERYCIYRLQNDGWPYGWIESATTISQILDSFIQLSKDPNVFGIWITREAYDGSSETTIIKVERSI